MRDISLQFLDMLRVREVEVAHEPMRDPKAITFKIAKFSPALGENEHQFHLRELNILANLFLAAGIAHLDCATHTSKFVEGQHEITLNCDVFGASPSSKSIYDRVVRVLALYETCRMFAFSEIAYKAYVSSHNLYPHINAISQNNLSDSEIRHKLIAVTDAPKPVLDILTCSPGCPDQALQNTIALLQTKLNTTCMGFVDSNLRESPHSVFRIYLNEDYPCAGHPELLTNAAIGMYHCEYCGDMQLAGTFHLPREYDDATS